MEMLSLTKELKENAYPGRGIVLGKSEDGKKAVAAYFIMGRSENSRNRVFVEDGEGIRTQAFDPSKLVDPSLIIYAPVRVLGNKTIVTNGDHRNRVFVEDGEGIRTQAFDPSKLVDPSLIIYAPVRVLGNKTIVTNGDQTDTIYEGMDKQLTFEQSLRSREFEPDGPNYTPRISGIMHVENGKYNYAMSYG